MSLRQKIPLGAKAFIVLYDEDLSSNPLGVVTIDENTFKRIEESWLAIIIHKRDNECVSVAVSRGSVVQENVIDPPYMYVTRESILRRDPRFAKQVCGDE